MAQDPLKFLRDRQGPARAPLIKEPDGGAAAQRPAAPSNRPIPPSQQRAQQEPEAQAPSTPQQQAAPEPSPEAQRPAEPAPAPVEEKPEGTGRLIVGPAIKMKGEIGACDTLVVQGEVEASMSGRVMEVAEGGVFKGKVELEQATVSGKVDGSLTVSGLLTITRGGEVRGTVRYGELQIQSGGVIAGDVGLTGDEVEAPEKDQKASKPSGNAKTQSDSAKGEQEKAEA